MPWSSLRSEAENCAAVILRSVGGTSVSVIWPDEPWSVESMLLISGCFASFASARAMSGAADAGVVPASVWRRTLRRLWSCVGMNSVGMKRTRRSVAPRNKTAADEHLHGVPEHAQRGARAYAALEPREGAVDGAPERASVLARRAEDLRAARRRQRDRLEVREQHGDGERHAELEEELPDDALHEDDGQEDGDDGERRGERGEGDLLRAVRGRPSRGPSPSPRAGRCSP